MKYKQVIHADLTMKNYPLILQNVFQGIHKHSRLSGMPAADFENQMIDTTSKFLAAMVACASSDVEHNKYKEFQFHVLDKFIDIMDDARRSIKKGEDYE